MLTRQSNQNQEFYTVLDQDNAGNWWVTLHGPDGEEVPETALYTKDRSMAVRAWLKY